MEEHPSISDLQQQIARLQQQIAELEVRPPAGATADSQPANTGSDLLFRKIFEHSNDAIFLIDPDLNETLDVNTRACDLLEYRREELLTLPISVIFPNDMARLQAFALSVLEQGHGWIGEVVCQSRSGRQLEIEISASELSLSADHPSCIIALLRDITERKITEARIKASLEEKEVLLKEIHHRVKNNLQIISSLFDLQSGETTDETVLEMFRECRNRVRSMAMIHERLYSADDLARIDAAQYLSTLTNDLAHSYGLTSRHVNLRLQADEVYLEVDKAIPCGLIVNELVSNALKYAFQSEDDGEIVVQLEPVEDSSLELTVRDNGVGFPSEINFRNTSSLGLRLVNSLVDQLDGEIEMSAAGGTCFAIVFPTSKKK